MAEENKNVVIEETDITVTDAPKKEPSFVVKAGKWLWARKGYVLTALGGFAAGAAAMKFGGHDDDDSYDTTDYEVTDVSDEGPTED